MTTLRQVDMAKLWTKGRGKLGPFAPLHGDWVAPEAVGFEAEMPAGRARMAYWPATDGGFHWVVESRTKKGWNRFAEHRYRAAGVS
jgi:hypothetical protein